MRNGASVCQLLAESALPRAARTMRGGASATLGGAPIENDGCSRVDSDRRGELRRMLGVADHEICFFARRQRPYLSGETERSRGARGDAAQRFSGRQAEQRAGQVQ